MLRSIRPSSRRSWHRVSLSGLCLSLFAGCYEEDAGPHVEAPPETSNACIALTTAAPESFQNPDGLLMVFDCLNSENAFDPLRSPLAYLVNTDFAESESRQSMGYLEPYFSIPNYLEPLGLDTYIQGGDLKQTIQALETLLNDPDQPLDALLRLYVDLYDAGHLETSLVLSQAYAAYVYAHCTIDDCPLLDMAGELYASEALEVLQARSADLSAAIDPRLSEDLAADLLELARATSSSASSSGENLLFGMTARYMVAPLQDNPEKTIDDSYVAEGQTLLEALQRPLCQLRSDRETLDAFSAVSRQLYQTGQLDYLPLHLRTLVNYSPEGQAATVAVLQDIDFDGDGLSVHDGDCDDTDPAVFPGTLEVLDDLKDNDCDLVADEPAEDADLTCDRNRDGNEDACGAGSFDPDCDTDCDGVSPNRGDCNDVDPLVHPGLKIYGDDGSIRVIAPAAEFDEAGAEDLRDNDCDGFVDRIPSSMDLLFSSLPLLLPLTYEMYDEEKTFLTYLVETLASQGSVDTEALLDANGALIESTLSNLSNGVMPPDMTARMRATFPVMSVLADMGLLSSASLSSLLALNTDHREYQQAREDAQEAGNSTELNRFNQYAHACGEEFDRYVDSLTVLDDVVRGLDAYSVLEDPAMLEVLVLAANSDLLVDAVKLYPLSVDENGESDPAATEATLELFDYFFRPPSDSGLYFDNYASARIWTVMPMLELLFKEEGQVDAVEAMMMFVLDGMEDPESSISGAPAALEALAGLDTGSTVDTDGLISAVLSPDARRILINGMAIAADEQLPSILMGRWEELSPALRESYETDETVLEFTATWIREGVIGGFLDLAGELLSWVIDTTALGSEPYDFPAESTPAP